MKRKKGTCTFLILKGKKGTCTFLILNIPSVGLKVITLATSLAK